MVVKLRWRKLKNGQRSYYLDYHIKGKRYREFLKLHLRYGNKDDKELLDLAKSIQRKKINDLTSKDFDIASVTKEQSGFLVFFDRYIENYQKKDIRKVMSSRLNVERFFTTILKIDDIQIKDLSPDICTQFRDYLEAGFTGETAQSYYRVFKKVIKSAILKGFLKTNPSEDVTVKKQPTELNKQVLFDDEIQALAKTHCGNDLVKRAFLFACYTGLGKAEIEGLQWKNVLNDQVVYKREKTDQPLVIPLSRTAKELLGDPGDPEGVIFQLISDAGTNKVLRNWVKRAGIDKHISFYCGRHSFAVRLLTHGVDMMTISKLMGQTSTKHLEKYLHFIDHLKRPAIEKLPEITL